MDYTEDALVLLTTAAPSDCLFERFINLHIHYITYK